MHKSLQRIKESSMNVISMTGQPLENPEPDIVSLARVIAHQSERISTLTDLLLRMGQQIQDELDQSLTCNDTRPDLVSLLDEYEQVMGSEAVL